MTHHDQTLNRLRKTGHRITPQRQIVLKVIETSTEHLDADAIYQRAREKDPTISIATVYRTLSMLKNMGLIEQLFLARNHAREHYEAAGAPEHYHFTCLGCRQVIEFHSPRIAQMRTELKQQHGMEIEHACVCLEGYCRSCAEKRQSQE